MWLPDKGLLSAPGFNKNSLFIVQAWHELLTATTTDSFRARAFDVYLLLEELDRIIEVARQDERWLSHVQAICEEIESEKTDFLRLLGNSPAIVSALGAITRLAVKGEKQASKADLSALSERIKILRTLIGDYNKLIATDAIALSTDAKKKGDLLQRIGTIATHIQKQGLTDESLALIDDSLVLLPPDEVVNRLCSPLGNPTRKFKCIVAVKSKTAENIYKPPRFELANSGWFQKSETSKQWHSLHADRTYVAIEVEAASERLAAEHALAELNTLMNLAVLYSNNSDHHFSASILVECGQSASIVEITPSKHFGLSPRNNSIKIAQSRYDQMPEKVRGRMGNILEAHAIAMASEEPRTSIINLWIAMEAIAGGSGNNSIGQRVQSAISPVVVWRRTDKVITYLGIHLKNLMNYLGEDIDQGLMPASSRTKIDRRDLLACLTGPAKNPGIMELFSHAHVSPLMCYRLYAAWHEYSDPKAMKSALNLSMKRTSWQLLRIYRARNLLVHKGERNDYVWRLLENAQYYVSTVLSRILHDLSVYQDWSIETSLESYRQKFDQLIERLDRPDGDGLSFSDVLMYDQDDTKLWGEGSRFATSKDDDSSNQAATQ